MMTRDYFTLLKDCLNYSLMLSESGFSDFRHTVDIAGWVDW